MLRSFLTFVAGGVVGLPVGAFLWYAFSPLLFDDVVNEKKAMEIVENYMLIFLETMTVSSFKMACWMFYNFFKVYDKENI